mgnify:CR=1 FL=1
MDGHQGALAFGDVAAKVLVARFLFTYQVEQVVLNLERQAGVKAKGAQGSDLLLAAAADDGPAGKWGGAAVNAFCVWPWRR